MEGAGSTGDLTPEEGAGDGRVSTEFTFWCGICIQWAQFPSQGSVTATAREFAIPRGWKRTKKFGWVCPRHRGKV